MFWVNTGTTFILASLLCLGCGQVRVASAPGGKLHITCTKGMKDCVTRASRLCEGEGYQVLSGQSRSKILGGASSPYRKVAEMAELDVQCGTERPTEKHDIVFKLPKREDSAPASLAPGATMCVPGATQGCIGPGGCTGGQVCLKDGSGYGACDCGPAASTPPASGAATPPSPETPSSPKRLDPPDSGPPSTPPVTGVGAEPVPLAE